MSHSTLFSRAALLLAATLTLTSTACMVGPKYARPTAPAAPEFKEAEPPATAATAAADLPPAQSGTGTGWKPGTPSDAAVKGNWWEDYGDPQLNALEVQVDQANQTLKAAVANFQAARGQIQYNKANLAPTVSVGPTIGAVRDSAHQPYFNNTLANSGDGSFSLPIDLNYEVDLWGRIRRSITAAREDAQASAADLQNARLSLQAELAVDYFEVRATDAQLKLVNDTIGAYQQAYDLTNDRFVGGAAPQSDVAQARTQLDTAKVLATDLTVARAQYEHAIAVLIGKPPATYSLAPSPINQNPPQLPQIPGMLPSQLLERRPDIAASERRMASANEQIGIADAAFYPTLDIGGQGGFLGTSALNWFTWPSRFWAVGPTLSQTLYDHGRRRSVVNINTAMYDQTVANYRQTTLTAFQQVEDNLAALRILATEAEQQHATTDSAEQSLDLFNTRYQGGVDTYLQVITWQTAALDNERNDIDIMRRRLEASVLLYKAIGGGWSTAQLPKV